MAEMFQNFTGKGIEKTGHFGASIPRLALRRCYAM